MKPRLFDLQRIIDEVFSDNWFYPWDLGTPQDQSCPIPGLISQILRSRRRSLGSTPTSGDSAP